MSSSNLSKILSPYDIALILPSRGLIFAETLKELLRELRPYKHKIYWSHGNSLPSCFNKPLLKALKQPHSHIWIVEDDMILPKGILKELLDTNERIIVCDYPLVKQPSGTILYDKDDNAIFTGTGCMLARKEVFKDIPRPIFRSDIQWGFKLVGDKIKFTAENVHPDKVYGYHDITFGLYQYIFHEPIKWHDKVLSQRKLVKKGDNNTNNGADEIEIFDQYQKINHFLIESEPEKKDILVSVMLDGKEVMMLESTAKRLLAKNLADLPALRFKNIIIDTNKVKKAEKLFRRTNE